MLENSFEKTTETPKTQITKQTPFKAKGLSRGAMVFATIWVIIMSILSGAKIIELNVKDIILVGIVVVVIWSPVYMSIWIDKFVTKGGEI